MYSIYKCILYIKVLQIGKQFIWIKGGKWLKNIVHLVSLRKEVVAIIFVSLQSEEEFARYPKPVYSTNNEKDH